MGRTRIDLAHISPTRLILARLAWVIVRVKPTAPDQGSMACRTSELAPTARFIGGSSGDNGIARFIPSQKRARLAVPEPEVPPGVPL